MIAYKLMKQRKDGSLGSLFIGAAARLPLDTWMESECIPKKGFALRQGWHCCIKPVAPHLSKEGRVWVKVEVKDTTKFPRPESQGGTWILADQMRIIEVIG